MATNTEYENIYEWADKEEGTCFYCKKDKPVELKLIGEKGVCKECLDEFKIGNISADRHVIYRIMPEFNNYQDVVDWLEEKGAHLVLADIDEIGGNKVYIYRAINNADKTIVNGYDYSIVAIFENGSLEIKY